ncbi:uncharacterized protein PITG_18662 [Phytophthora infestans T30-4]|uniref:Uncharacterized protein n=1 Tax=Phytophthora infestans (strain T30-4) TaxID=403677 RepID=D0NZA2_PHYIT|nr:uncharacterized protein PITG_18662 [Phytophthora infestans T30-4]EEY68911.1 conserved hypothetical protein [Phytophthora infestans T30-4]|eukprot:XP_002997297.1 conserved hypothetical protein [Phytophthora infestans T30-4]
MVELDVDGALFDSAAVWSAFWFVDAETHGRAIERADVRHATVGLFGCIRGGVWNAVERLDVLRQPDISWRCRDLDLAVGLHTMVEVNETGSMQAKMEIMEVEDATPEVRKVELWISVALLQLEVPRKTEIHVRNRCQGGRSHEQ